MLIVLKFNRMKHLYSFTLVKHEVTFILNKVLVLITSAHLSRVISFLIIIFFYNIFVVLIDESDGLLLLMMRITPIITF